jgi:hypothetical protein
VRARLFAALLLFVVPGAARSAEPGKSAAGEKDSLYEITADLVVPPVLNAKPAPGRRVRATTAGWENTSVYHAIYLPRDWREGGAFPIVAEFPGNGGYQRNGDTSQGTPDGCSIGYGLSGGEGAIWVCLPFVDTQAGHRQNCTIWWGDVEETKRYCTATVRDVCIRFGGDPKRVVLAGFSRGAIACNFIGLHDDAIASLWCAFFCHSHYDGVRESWPYPGADRASSLVRLKRLGGRPQWISHEASVAETQGHIERTGVRGQFTFTPLPFPNHTDQWLLRNLPVRAAAQRWFLEAIR